MKTKVFKINIGTNKILVKLNNIVHVSTFVLLDFITWQYLNDRTQNHILKVKQRIPKLFEKVYFEVILNEKPYQTEKELQYN